MADVKTTAFTEREAWPNTRSASRSYREVQAPIRVVRVVHTLLGTEAAADVLKLEIPRIEGYLLPELSRVTNVGGGDVDMDIKLQRLPETGAAVDITTAASIDNNGVAFARPTGGVPLFLRDDTLQGVLSNVDAATAADTLVFELLFYCPEGI